MSDLTVIEPKPIKLTRSKESRTILAAVAEAAKDKSVDPGKMRELWNLQREMMAMEAERLFNEAMRRCQQELPRVYRNAEGDHKIRYTNLEALDIAVRPIIHKHGFSESFGNDESKIPQHYGVTCLVGHDAGHTRAYRADVPNDMLGPKGNPVKTALHGWGSSQTYGRRYLRCMIFNIVLTNDKPGFRDDDGQSAGQEVEYASFEQLAEIRTEANNRSIDIEKVLAVARVEEIGLITAKQVPMLLEKMRRT